jgi:hypothetical protein
MPINNMEEFDKVVNVSWYTPEKSPQDLKSATSPTDLTVY